MMFRRFSLLLALPLGLLAARPAPAQTPLGQPSLDEAKVQIWCATARFVYDDAGRPNLKSTVRCAGADLPALATSLRPDSLRVYSVLYQPIEGRGVVYQDKKTTSARLGALVKAIVQKLKASPARRRDPARLARLQALETALTNYVASGTPPGDVPAAMVPTTADTTATAGNGAPGPAEAAEAQAQAVRDANPGAMLPPRHRRAIGRYQPARPLRRPAGPHFGHSEPGAVRDAAHQPGAVAAAAAPRNLSATHAAAGAKTAAEQAAAAVADAAARVKRAEALVLAAGGPSETPATPAAELLTPTQRLEVERLVSQRVDEEMAWLRGQLPELLAAAAGATRAGHGGVGPGAGCRLFVGCPLTVALPERSLRSKVLGGGPGDYRAAGEKPAAWPIRCSTILSLKNTTAP
ncbi:hypothetical protein [Hymenobacter coccineus]|uniref:Uncharacterized protein n=1 Tax=Hymenobacter coccineus TaxID=1908235 RepID=A0A1G1TLD1_9BACT|nr:hypothetical protein [Hymenobacter coccineus]OGX91660.1 hypothetical protein BEN49_04600 [Hymenobacter coccineus]